MKSSEALRRARDLLTPITWSQGSYFSHRNGNLCMCAHGALQAQVNLRVREILGENVADAAAPAAVAQSIARCAHHATWSGAARAARTADAGSCAEAAECGDMGTVWHKRPEWISHQDPIYGSVEAHYLLGLVGLTINKNDDPKTSLEFVKMKFNEAISLAEKLEV